MQRREIIIRETQPSVTPQSFGYEIGEAAHAYGAARPFWLLHYVVSGFGTFRIGGQSYAVKPGEIFVIPPYEETWYGGDAHDPWDYIWIGFLLDGAIPEALRGAVLSCPAAGRIFEEMKQCAERQEGRSAFLAGKLLLLFSALSEQSEPKAPDYVRLAVSCMESEYNRQELSVQSIADRLGLDRSYFSVLFRKATGVTPHRFLTRVRMEKAAELLAAHGQSAATTAASCGYADPACFSRAFSAYFGVSPRQYRRERT